MRKVVFGACKNCKDLDLDLQSHKDLCNILISSTVINER